MVITVSDLTLTSFDCEEDLAQYKDSLLFPSEETFIADAAFNDKNGNTVSLSLEVRGAISIYFNEEEYTDPEDYPKELIKIIQAGEAFTHPDVEIGNNNWFEVAYSIRNADGKDILSDGEVFGEDLVAMTPDNLKKCLTEYAEDVYDRHLEHIKENTVAQKTKHKSEINRG